MKKTAIIFSTVIVILNFVSLGFAKQTNAKLVNYIFGRYDYSFFLVIPDNIEEYPFLGHYPFTAFMLLNFYDEEKLANLTVKELKSRSLAGTDSCCASDAFYEVLKFEKIKGFEDIALELIDLDEFDIAARKKEILGKLTEIYGRYKQDFKKYLLGVNGTYRFRKGKLRLSSWNRLKEYNENVEINQPTAWSFYEQIDIKDYDFDKKLFKIELLSPPSRRSSNGWEYHYIRNFKEKYGHLDYRNHPALYNIDFPQEVQYPLQLDDAEKIFRNGRVFCETILTVNPQEKTFGYSGNAFFVMASNFKILKITKNYYNRKYWSNEEEKFIGEPVLTIELASEADRPLN